MGNLSGKTQKHHKDNKRHFKSYKLRHNTSNYHKKNSMRNYMRKRNNHTHRRGGGEKEEREEKERVSNIVRNILKEKKNKLLKSSISSPTNKNVPKYYEHSPTKSRYGFAQPIHEHSPTKSRYGFAQKKEE
jgi:hypothetical protein